MDFDLDLDFPLNDLPDMATTPAAITAQLPTAPERATEPTLAMKWDSSLGKLDMNLGTAVVAQPTLSSPAPSAKAVEPSARRVNDPSDGLTFTPESFTAATKPVLTPQKAAVPTVASDDSGMLEFDLASLSLDLPEPTTESPTLTMTDTSGDPLETRFLLAEEFRSMGDAEGARSLAKEVIAKSSGSLKVKAQAFLNALS